MKKGSRPVEAFEFDSNEDSAFCPDEEGIKTKRERRTEQAAGIQPFALMKKGSRHGHFVQ